MLRAGRTAQALDRAENFLVTKPRDPQMRFLRGVILTELGRQDEALTVFVRLTEDYPELPEPYNNLAVLYAGQQQFDKARAALEAAIGNNPGYATAHENLGDVYARLASLAYLRAAQLDPTNASAPGKLQRLRGMFQSPSTPAGPSPANGAAPGSRPAR